MAETGLVPNSCGAPRRPETMLVMSAGTLRTQFGEAGLARLAGVARRGDQADGGQRAKRA